MNFNNVFEELSKLYDNKSLTENFENDNGVKAWSKNAISYYEQAAKELGLVDYTMKMENRSGKDVAVITAMKNGKKLSAEESSIEMTNVKNVNDAKEFIQYVFPELSDVKEGIVDKVKGMFKKSSSTVNGDTKWAVVDNKTGKTVLNNVSEQEAQDYVKKQSSADNFDVLPIKEGCNKKALTEEADDEIEFAEEPVDVLPEEDVDGKEDVPEEDINTVDEFLKSIGEYDGDLKLEFKPIVIDGKEYSITNILWSDEEEGKLVAELVIDMPEEGEQAEEAPAEEVEENLEELLDIKPNVNVSLGLDGGEGNDVSVL